MNRKMRSRQKASVSTATTYLWYLCRAPFFIFQRSRRPSRPSVTTPPQYCFANNHTLTAAIIHNPFIMSALVPRVGTGMSVQSQMSSSGRPSGRTPSGSALACNRCSKPLATTCFLCSCDCIFCEGKLYTSFVIHIDFVGSVIVI